MAFVMDRLLLPYQSITVKQVQTHSRTMQLHGSIQMETECLMS